MTQTQAIVLAFKIAEVSGLVTIAGFITCYSYWAPWWKDEIGRTIVVKDLLLVLAFVPTLLSVFFRFNEMASRVVAWFDFAVIALISPVMIWRTVVFWKIHRAGKRGRDRDGS